MGGSAELWLSRNTIFMEIGQEMTELFTFFTLLTFTNCGKNDNVKWTTTEFSPQTRVQERVLCKHKDS